MLSILGMGCSHPGGVIDNDFLEGLGIESSGAWILEKIGIRTRRTSLPLDYISRTKNVKPVQAAAQSGHTSTDLGVEAGRIALDRAGVTAGQIGLVLVNCCTPEAFMPSEALRIARGLGIQAMAYDVQTACPAFALHLDYLSKFSEGSLPEFILCLSTATMTRRVNYTDRSDSSILSDGAAAWVVSPKQAGKLELLDSFFTADPRRADAVVIDTFGHFHQEGRVVRDFSVRQTVHLLKRLEARHSIDWSRDVFIGHQANATMLQQITNNRKIPSHNHWHNVTTMGNQAGAGAPAVLAQHWDEIRPGQKIVLALVGAGLSWGTLVLQAR